jgi:hypothetical protein
MTRAAGPLDCPGPLNGKLNRSVTLPATSLTSAGTNWLITGSDSRAGLSRAEIDAMHVGFDEGTLNFGLHHAAAHGQRPPGADQHPA